MPGRARAFLDRVTNTMGKVINIHDKFLKAILADKSLAMDYFRDCLPASVSSLLDFSTLTQLPGTYLSKELQETMSDIVYSCKSRGGELIKVSLLIEHKSHKYKNTPIQLGSYIFSGLQQQIDNKEKLSIIIPILLYHGKESWQYTTLADLFENLPKEWEGFIPNFDYVYNNLSTMEDEELNALSNQFLAASFLTLKHYMEGRWLDENAVRVFNLAADAPGNLLEQFAVYFLKYSESNRARIVEILESVPKPVKEKIMSTLDFFKELGLEEGRKEGIRKGLEEGRKEGREEGREEGAIKARAEIVSRLIQVSTLTDEQIASAANVTSEFVANVRANSFTK